MNLFYLNTYIAGKRIQLINGIIVFSLFICISNAFGQNTTIVFNTKENITFSISKEVDNTYTRTLTDEISTDATGSCVYSWDVNDFQFIECFFHDGGTIFFPIKEGSHLTITYKGDFQVEIAGADKAEVEFYTNGYKDITRPFVRSLFSSPTESGFENLSLLIEKYSSVLSNTLDSLVAENTISLKFSNIVKNDFYTVITCAGISVYQNKYLENAAQKISEQDSIKVEKIINGILDKIPPMIDSGNILKYSSGSSALAFFYGNKYRSLNEKKKEELFSRKTWAGYLEPHRLGYLIAPEEIQYKLLSLKLLDNYENAVFKGDTTIFNYISKIRPQNAFLPYLKEEQEKLLVSMNADHSGVKYIENTINALEDLNKVGAFDQKVLYIDIWATWCSPCVAEFKHKDKLHELLMNYEGIIPVYISIDGDSNDIAWKEKTKVFNLKGYHLRANKKLRADINEKLFGGEGIGVPQYLLLDKEGNVLAKDLPRPSNIDKLKQELDKHFY